jgi:predicted ArsR family transcriptional regulator|tara:strand:+ start:224 stop:469 length:246 start_codon:yes stop_codon:yes gene_type:complete
MYFVKTNFRKSTRMAILYAMLCRPNGALASEIAKRLSVNAYRIRAMMSELRSRDIKIYSIHCIETGKYGNLSETRYFVLTQ